MQFLSPLPAALNHLLAQEPWALAKLAEHAGKTACIDLAVLQIRLHVMADGLLQQAAAETSDNVTLHIKLADLPLILQNPERAFAAVKIVGDAEFASVLALLMQNLHWEAEHDLQKLVGEIAARRMVQGTQQGLRQARQGAQKFNENLAEYLLEENPMLVRPQAVEKFADHVGKLRDDVERLEKRLQRLNQLAQQCFVDKA